METKIKSYLEKLETIMFHKEGDSQLQSAHKLGLKEAYFLAKEILQEENNTKEDSIFPPISELTLKEDLDKFPNSLFCFHGETFILELKIRDNELIAWVNYANIWNPISTKNNWNYDQTQSFLKVKIEKYFKLRDVTPSFRLWMWTTLIEEYFKLRDVTPKDK